MHPANFIDRTGTKNGKLTAIKYVSQYPNSYWVCKCDCGVIKNIKSSYMKTTKSCGCFRKEVSIERMATHKMSKSAEYQQWAAMKRRCQTPTDSCYYKYGAKGIKVCDRWQRFENFIEDMGRKPSQEYSIERVDYNGNYEPSNCKWATRLEQAKNKSNNRHLTVRINGKDVTKIIPEWSRESDVAIHTIRARLKKGIDPYTAVFTPASPYRKFT